MLPLNVITASLAKRMIGQRCKAYLAHIVDTRIGNPNIKDIPTVCDFPDVFADDLPWLLPKKEMEFEIETLLGVEPISITPYRMSPVELKELKVQM